MVNHDSFCWECSEQNTTLQCSTCIRTFHRKCAANVKIRANEVWICPVCAKLTALSSNEKEKNLELLPQIIDRVWNYRLAQTFNPDGDNYFKTKVLMHPIDLSTIKDKIDSYTSFDHFLSDVQWFVHNCEVAFSVEDKRAKRARLLQRYIYIEIDSIKKCLQCHMNAAADQYHWFTMVCDKPHLIIWAHMKGARYWPAKVMSVNGQQVNVRFFGCKIQGYRKHDDVPAQKCFLYSAESPRNSKKDKPVYKAARNEANQYIENVRLKFGSFNLARTRTAFNPALLSHYLLDMINGTEKEPTDALETSMNEFSNIQQTRNCEADFEIKSSTTFSEDSLDVIDNINFDIDSNYRTPDLGNEFNREMRVELVDVLKINSTENDERRTAQARDLKRTKTVAQSKNKPNVKKKRRSCRIDVNSSDSQVIKPNDEANFELNVESFNETNPEPVFTSRSQPILDRTYDASDLRNENLPPHMTDNDVDPLNLNQFKGFMNSSMQNLTLAFDRVYELNVKLEKKLKDCQAKRETDVKELEERNTNLLQQIEQLENKMNKKNVTLKETEQKCSQLEVQHARRLANLESQWETNLKNQLRIINDSHEVELSRFRVRYARKMLFLNKDNRRLIAEHGNITDKMNEELVSAVNDAKHKKFCLACDKAKPSDIYVCDMECQQRLWEQSKINREF